MTRKERALAGMCSICKLPATHGRMCEHHAKRNAEMTRKVRALKKANGICQRCPAPAKGYPTYSAYCERHAVETKMYIDTYVSGYDKKRYQERRAAGVCVTCGNQRYGKRLRCRKCTMLSRVKCMNWYNANRRAA